MAQQNRTKVLYPQQLNFVYGNDPRYWIIPQRGAARAVQVSLLSVSGCEHVANGKYRVSFEVSLKDDAFGWEGTPLLVAAKVGKGGRFTYKEVSLDNVSSSPQKIPSENSALEIEVANDAEIHFGLYELSKKKWKGGLEIHSALVQKVA